ncbi:MAG: hypothetical protein V1806_14565 [Pseudomonadota bacterium]
MSAEPYSAKMGVVLLLDALGAKNFTTESAKIFIKARDSLLEDLKPDLQDWHNRISSYAGQLQLLGSNNEATSSFGEPKFVTFGDTIVLTWEIPDKYRVHISGVGIFLTQLFVKALGIGLFFRGAISYGQYIQDESTILGPAVADAAAWYEKADWMGIIAAPMCGMILSRFATDNEPSRNLVNAAFIEYNIPLKANSKHKMWALNWPKAIDGLFAYKAPFKDKTDLPLSAPISYLLSRFEGLIVTPEIESKYSNTVEFLNWCLEKDPYPNPADNPS